LDAAADSPSRTVEGSQEAVTSGLDLSAPKAFQLSPHDRVVGVQKMMPGTVAQLPGFLSGSHDVGEQNRGQDPICRRDGPHPCEELLDFVSEAIGVTGGHREIFARQLSEGSTLNLLGEEATMLRSNVTIVPPM
jgi:hypothetical protein